jgi:hypothetical protein
MRTITNRTLAGRTTTCALIAVMAASTAHAQTTSPADATSAPASALEMIRRDAAGGLSAATLNLRDWRLNPPSHPMLTPPTGQGRVGSPMRLPRHRLSQRRSGPYRDTQRVLAGVAMGIVGLLVGGMTGATLEGDCRCDDPGLQGFVIGAPVGAAAGFALGWGMVR